MGWFEIYEKFFKSLNVDNIGEVFSKFTKQQQMLILDMNSDKDFWDEKTKDIAEGIFFKTEIVRQPISREEYFESIGEKPKEESVKEILGDKASRKNSAISTKRKQALQVVRAMTDEELDKFLKMPMAKQKLKTMEIK